MIYVLVDRGRSLKSAMDNKPLETQSGGGVVLNSEGKVLVVSQHGRSWSLPKGHVEAGEEILEAAKREIYEESGIHQLEYVRDLGKYQRFRGTSDGTEDPSELKTIFMFLFTTNEMDLRPVDQENPEARWVNKEDVADLLTFAKDKEFFRKIVSSI